MNQEDSLGFFLGICVFVCLGSSMMWGIYVWGYSNGVDSELHTRVAAASALEKCNDVILGWKK